MAKKQEAQQAAEKVVRGAFSLDNFKLKKGFAGNSVKFKEQGWIPLSPAFQEITSIPGIPTGHITLLRGHSDTGKAQPLTSKVLTPEGWREMGQIQVGDSVVGSDGTAKRVLGIYPQGSREVYEVHFTDGSIVETCEEHLWEVETYRDRRSNYGRKRRLEKLNRKEDYYKQDKILTTKELQKDTLISPSPYKHPDQVTRNYKIRVISKPVEFVQKEDLVVPPYTLGALIGDGSLTPGGIGITSVDPHILHRISQELPPSLDLRQVGGTITFGIRTTDLSNGNLYIQELKELGLTVKSEHKFIPKKYLFSSTAARRLLLQGLMDTDGTLDPNGMHTYYSTTSKQLAEDVQELARSLGHVASISFRENEFLGCYKVTVVDNGVEELFSLPRKKNRHIKKTKYPAAKYVEKVVNTGRKEEMQCIYIDSEDHLYVTDGYTLTHNTTALIEAAVNAQASGILPVFIITEMKWSWEHAREMGLKFEPVMDERGDVVDYKGFFLYADRSSLNTIEDVAVFISDLIDEQSKGNLPHDLCFFWDSIGSVPCELSVRSNKNNNEWNAGAMSTQFGNNLNQKILLSRKENSKYTNTLVAINKVWTMKPESPMGQPKLANKGGMAMWYDATMVITFGNITNPGTSKIKAIKNGKQVEFAKRTNVQVEKNHISGVTTRGRIVMTQHGFIHDTPRAVETYKNAYKDHWLSLLGSTDFDLIEEGDMEESLADIGELDS
jgi:hypothetical protein